MFLLKQLDNRLGMIVKVNKKIKKLLKKKIISSSLQNKVLIHASNVIKQTKLVKENIF